jgi:hypothetical protein
MKELNPIDPSESSLHPILDAESLFSKAQPSPYLEAKVMRRLETEMAGSTQVSTTAWRLRLAGLALLLAANAFTFLYISRRNNSAKEQSSELQTSYWSYEAEIQL